MMTLGEMQMSGMLTMVMLALILVLRVPRRAMRHRGFAKARWLMVGGTLLIALQFLLQHQMGLRQMGVTQGVLMNLLMLMPASMLIGMAVLNVQRQGHVSLKEWAVGSTLVLVSTVLLLAAVFLDGRALFQESKVLRYAEYVGAALFATLQIYMFLLQYREYRRLQRAVDEYYDRERHDLLNWMGLSVTLLALLALLVPFAIFFQGLPLVIFSVVIFFSIFYCVISLYSYGISKDADHVEEAEGQESSEPLLSSPETILSSSGEHLSSSEALVSSPESPVSSSEGNTNALAVAGASSESFIRVEEAREMHVPVRLLQAWLRQSEYKKLATLMNQLRVEDAQRVLRVHPDWASESVADYCGFSSRQYFHQMFVQHTGTTPAKYQKSDD